MEKSVDSLKPWKGSRKNNLSTPILSLDMNVLMVEDDERRDPFLAFGRALCCIHNYNNPWKFGAKNQNPN